MTGLSDGEVCVILLDSFSHNTNTCLAVFQCEVISVFHFFAVLTFMAKRYILQQSFRRN